MKVYLAGPYQHKDSINVAAEQLRCLGIEVTSSWLEEPHKPTTQMQDLTHEEHLQYAERDVLDLIAADVFVLFADQTKSIIRAGRHVEFGMAVAINRLVEPMPIFVVGPEYENIFHHLQEVKHFDCWELAVDALCREKFLREAK